MPDGTRVEVREPGRTPWVGVVENYRENIRGLGSVEFLVRPNGPGRHACWVYAQFLEVES